VSRAVATTRNTIQNVGEAVENTASNLSARGQSVATGLQSRMAELDPESHITDAFESAGRAATGAVEGAAEGAGTAAAETLGSVALEAVPVVGELAGLGFGLYSFFHSFDKPKVESPPVMGMARPIFSAGI
jgi:ABC-type glutathione transport system ATPase component